MVNYNEFLSMATQADPFQQFLQSIGAARLDSAGRPVGITGGAVAVSPDQERQLAQFQQPQGSASGVQGAPPATQANPLAKLNSALGLSIGMAYEGSQLRQATDAMPAGVQVAGAMSQQNDQNRAAIFAQKMQESGGMPVLGSPDFSERSRAAELMYQKIYGQPESNTFMQPRNAYMGGPGGPNASQVLAAGGKELTGFGGTQISGQAGPNGNRFFLRQGPTPPAGLASRPAPSTLPASGPSTAATNYLRTGSAPVINEEQVTATVEQVQPAQAAQRPSALQSAQQQYNQTIAAMSAPKTKLALEQGFMEDPNRPGTTIPIPGSDAERKRQAEATANTERENQATERANGVVAKVNEILPQLNSLTTGPMAAVTRGIPGTPAYNVEELKKPIQSALTIDTLSAMRAASKNGASGFGQLTDKELNLLNTAVENLNTAQGEDAVRKALVSVRNSFIRAKAGMEGGRLDPSDRGNASRISAIKWALANPNDPRSDKILTLGQ
jgi:hypothetical protein